MQKTVSRNARAKKTENIFRLPEGNKSCMAVFLRRQQPLLVKIKIVLDRAF